MRSNYRAPFYICANVVGGFVEDYELLFISRGLAGATYLLGMMVFREFGVIDEARLAACVPLLHSDSIVEIHGIAPDELNVGIYCGEEELANSALRKCFVARHVGGGFYEKCRYDSA